MAKEIIPRKAVYRLSLYHRHLQTLLHNEVDTVSSEALARAAGVKPSQLRKDLGYVGQFGVRGLGYSVLALHEKLHEVLGTARLQPVILVGAGNLGAALLHYPGFAREGFEVVGAFDIAAEDSDEPKVLPMSDMHDFVQNNGIKMAILSVPATVAQEVVNELVAAGIQAVLNFAPVVLQVPDGVVVNTVDLALELENLSYFIR